MRPLSSSAIWATTSAARIAPSETASVAAEGAGAVVAAGSGETGGDLAGSRLKGAPTYVCVGTVSECRDQVSLVSDRGADKLCPPLAVFDGSALRTFNQHALQRLPVGPKQSNASRPGRLC